MLRFQIHPSSLKILAFFLSFHKYVCGARINWPKFTFSSYFQIVFDVVGHRGAEKKIKYISRRRLYQFFQSVVFLFFFLTKPNATEHTMTCNI